MYIHLRQSFVPPSPPKMRCSLQVLKQLGAASTAAEYVGLVNSQAFAAVIPALREGQRSKLQQQGLTTLSFAALSNGLQLYIRCSNSACGNGGIATHSRCLPPSSSSNTGSSSRGGAGGGGAADGSSVLGEQLVDALTRMAAVLMQWHSRWPHGSREREKFVGELFNAGLVDTLSPVLQDLAQRLHFQQDQLQQLLQEQQQQQQQQQQSFTEALAATAQSLANTAETTNYLLDLWAGLTSLVTDNTEPGRITPAVAAAGVTPEHLSAAASAIAASWPCGAMLQQSQATLAAAARTSTSISQGQSLGSACLPGASMFNSLRNQTLLGVAADQLVRHLAHWATEDTCSFRAAVAATASLSDMVWAVIVFLSFVTQLIHAKQLGCSPINQHAAMLASKDRPGDSCSSSTGQHRRQPQQGMQVPAYHEQLLSAVGLSSYQAGDFGITAGLTQTHRVGSLLTVLPDSLAEWTHPDIPPSKPCLASTLHGSQDAQTVPPCPGSSEQDCEADHPQLAGNLPAALKAAGSSCSSSSRGCMAEALPSATRATAGGSPMTDQCMEGASCSSSGSSSSGGSSNRAAADMASTVHHTKGSSTNTSTSMLTDDTAALLHLFAPVLIELVALQPEEPLLVVVVAAVELAARLARNAVLAAAGRSHPDTHTREGAAGQADQSHGAGHKQQKVASGARVYIAMLHVLVPVYQHITAAGHSEHSGLQQQSDSQSKLGDLLFEVLAASMRDHLRDCFAHSRAEIPLEVMPPITVCSSLEGALRHCWPLTSYTGAEVAVLVLLSLSSDYMRHPSSQLLELITNSSKSSPLLSVMLSCLKRLHYSSISLHTQHHGSAEFACGIVGVVLSTVDLTLRWAHTCRTGSRLLCCSLQESHAIHHGVVTNPAAAESCHAPCSINADSSSSTVPNGPPSSSSSSSNNTTTTAATSTSSSATLSSAVAATGKGNAAAPPDDPHAGAVWLLLCGRSLFTAGTALQAAQHTWQHPAASTAQAVGGGAPTQSSSQLIGPSCPSVTLPELQRSLKLVLVLLKRMADQPKTVPAGNGMRGRQQTQVVLCVGRVSEGVIAAGEQLLRVVSAVLTHVKHLKQKTSAAGGQADDMDSSAGQLWQSVLCSEEGQRLPEGLKRFGRLLSAALPSRCCCNEPSCCCFDQGSELQLASGKGSKCSGCGVARYCGVADQTQHWQLHKAVCRALAGPAPAASAAGNQKAV